MTMTSSVAERLVAVRARIAAAGGDPARVRVVGVTKGFGPEAARAAVDAGLVDLGENYADELVDKATALGDAPVAWHFLGAIQRNKIARLVPHVALFEGVDRLEEGEAIAKRKPGAAVLIEVAAGGIDPALGERGGVVPDDVDALCVALSRLGLEVRGLMTVAPANDADAARRAFETVGSLRVRLGLEEASMGMTDDLEAAVQAGSTMVRIGRALFGERAQKA
jgi:PLP dependent protein